MSYKSVPVIGEKNSKYLGNMFLPTKGNMFIPTSATFGYWTFKINWSTMWVGKLFSK